MLKYRIRQLIRVFMSYFSNISYNDNIYLKKYLNYKQLNLFNELSMYEKKHSLYIARDIENNYRNNISDRELEILIKASLLHDVGKIKSKLNLFDRVFFVIMNGLIKDNLKKIKIRSLEYKIYVYYNHGEIGYELLKNCSEDEMLYLVRYHHNKCLNDYKLKILQKFDERN